MKSATRDLLTWIAEEPRTYPEALDVWRTTCPQHSVWEDALGERLIAIVRNGSDSRVVVTPRGRAALADEI
ncbi:MAG TPA: hypothetical protein VJ807_11240 [Gaiellaceae bacterium]|nr:hypothetical protein [Gaiellaceae bacterium]